MKGQKHIDEIKKNSSSEPLGKFQPNLVKRIQDFTNKDQSLR